MHVHARRVIAIIALVLAGFVWTAPSAEAHTGTSHTPSGCLIYIHHNSIGSLGWQDSETCATRDNFWRGRVRDDHAPSDGHCVDAILDGNRMARSCDAVGNPFTFRDPQLNYNAYTWICRSDGVICYGTSNQNF